MGTLGNVAMSIATLVVDSTECRLGFINSHSWTSQPRKIATTVSS